MISPVTKLHSLLFSLLGDLLSEPFDLFRFLLLEVYWPENVFLRDLETDLTALVALSTKDCVFLFYARVRIFI